MLWDSVSEDILLTALAEAVTEARTGDNNFQPSVYSDIVSKLENQGYTFNVKQVISRWTRFKTARNIVHFLRGRSGFGWDEGSKTVTASEAVWKGLLYDSNGMKVKKFTEYNKWRNKAFPEYDRVTELMGGNQATGNLAFSSASGAAAAPPPASDSTEDPSRISTPPPLQPPATSEGPEAAEPQVEGTPSGTQVTHPVISPVLSPPRSASASKRSPSPFPVTPAPKRSRSANTATQLNELCGSVKELVHGLVGDTDGSGTSFSPVRQKAWDKVKEEEGLSPYSLARARRVFRSKESVKEYLSFGDTEMEARAFWLQDEMDHANRRD